MQISARYHCDDKAVNIFHKSQVFWSFGRKSAETQKKKYLIVSLKKNWRFGFF
jgi:hypothetical protein